jgi:hypothetical protein
MTYLTGRDVYIFRKTLGVGACGGIASARGGGRAEVCRCGGGGQRAGVLHGVFVIILYPPLPVRYVTHIPGVSYREGGAYITGRSRR